MRLALRSPLAQAVEAIVDEAVDSEAVVAAHQEDEADPLDAVAHEEDSADLVDSRAVAAAVDSQEADAVVVVDADAVVTERIVFGSIIEDPPS